MHPWQQTRVTGSWRIYSFGEGTQPHVSHLTPSSHLHFLFITVKLKITNISKKNINLHTICSLECIAIKMSALFMTCSRTLAIATLC